MIKLNKVNKYFFHGKSNQIHVIDNTSMELPDSGIVCLLGPSGCGKTTLLNAIGGLDKIDGGSIIVDGDRITHRTAGKIDTIRNAKIGYIFQNFYLLDDKTVFENVAIALNMVGVTDKKAVAERVNYCLKSVGIYQYRNKAAGALSGGQRQRVAIARAIVKNPRIIIADEPTGNLDSANTIEIMNIIKTISKERLVILVTHERKIAEFYSDYVAEMKDGKIINAYTNDEDRALDYQLENKIYLRDMPVQKEFGDESIELKYYCDDDREASIKLAVRGGNLYIDTGGRLNVVDESSSVELIDDNYKAMDESVFEENAFQYDAYLPENFKARYTSIYHLGNIISKGWKSIKSWKKLKKLLLVGFVFAGMFAFLAVSNLIGIVDVQPEDYLTTNANYVTVSNPSKTDELMDLVDSLDEALYVIPGDTKKSVKLPLDDYLQTSSAYAYLNVSVCETSVLNAEDIVYGAMPTEDSEVVVDMMVVDSFLDDEEGKCIGITEAEQLIGRRITIDKLKDYTISGICDLKSPCMYWDSSQITHVLVYAEKQMTFEYDESDFDVSDAVALGQIKDFGLTDSKLTIKKGRKPEKVYEAIVPEEESSYRKVGDKLKTKLGGHKLEVVGFYSSDVSGENTIYVTTESLRQNYIHKQKNFTVYARSTKILKNMLSSQDVSCTVNMDRDKNTYIKKMKDSLNSSLIVAGIILLISLIEMYLMLRSSFLARIKEVGTMRAIGLKKRDIYRMFAGEIIVITLITAIPGIAIMYFLLSKIVMITDYLAAMYVITPLVAGISLVLVLVFNLLAGLIPVARTMRKTPATILARTDI